MSARADTMERLDPLTGAVIRPVTLSTSVVVAVYALTSAALSQPAVESPALSWLSAAMVVLAAGILAWRSSPARWPIGAVTHSAVLALALGAVAVAAAANWERNLYLRDDWGPIAVGLLCLGLSPYRPARELVAGGLLAAIGVGFVALLQSQHQQQGYAPGVLIAVAVTPVLALSLGSAAYVGSAVRSVRRWRGVATRAVRAAGDGRRDGLARTMQRDRVAILAGDVLPFFERLLDAGVVTERDRDVAADIADGIRQTMVAEADRTWLAAALSDAGLADAVTDPDRLAEAMTTDQRTALRATLLALLERDDALRQTLRIRVVAEPAGPVAEVRCELPMGDSAVRTDLAPFFAVLRFVFTELDLAMMPTTLTLRCRYDHP